MASLAQLHGLNLYLIGMMGAGKTTLGQELAHALGYQFFDTDTLIEQVAGQSIPQIFAAQGETGFRALETQVLSQLAAYTRLAIATGGGIVLRQENWGHLRQGLVIWLDVPLLELQTRLQGDTERPLLQTEDPTAKLTALLDERQRLYAQADLHVPFVPGETPAQTCDRILQSIPRVLKATPDTPPN